MAIEQVSMRDTKSSGGRGTSPSAIATWVHSTPASSRKVDAVEEFTGVVSTSSEQHMGLARVSLHLCLSTDMLADENVNCGKALKVGIAAMKQTEGMTFSEIDLKRKSVVASG
ncbi:hypothetical protein PR048_022067 [Dryococelus australis]|uniref:Uncharacterized protein n=1 Tax=Dryococelus australis TaxID=614101 RepID=A0ABQ9H034_9NEOP|nr:hypothetical protein PR048_022067 [Dryococelus australis]